MKARVDTTSETIRNLLKDSTFEELGIDLKTDPFGRNYDWLRTPQTPFERAYDELVNADPSRWHAAAGKAVRSAALGDSMASSTDEAVLETWVKDRFPALCKQAGDDGTGLFRLVKRYGDATRGMVAEVESFLAQQTELAELTHQERVAVAFMIIAQHGPKTK